MFVVVSTYLGCYVELFGSLMRMDGKGWGEERKGAGGVEGTIASRNTLETVE